MGLIGLAVMGENLVLDMESKWDQMHEIVQRECE